MFKFISNYIAHLTVLYILGAIVVIRRVYFLNDTPNYSADISYLSIVSTFGASLTAIGVLLTGEYLRRILLNVDILYKNLLNQENPWRRWPFLKRKSKRKSLNEDIIEDVLENPSVPINVGTHTINISIPTGEKDFFYLPIIKNLWSIVRYDKACLTVYGQDNKLAFESELFFDKNDEYMAFVCLKDIWFHIFLYRSLRYITHFGISLCIFSFIFWFYLIWI